MPDPSLPGSNPSKRRFRFPRWSFPQRQSPPRPQRQHPFSDSEVRAKAQQLYEQRLERGLDGTSEGDWQQAIKALKWERSLLGGTQNLLRLSWRADNSKDAIEVLKMGISAFGLIATVGAVIGLVINYQQGQERLITDRFAKSVEQLGNTSPDVQVGGIYSLERIAKDSSKDHWTVIEVLTAYVRDKSALPKGWLATPPGKRQPLPDVTNEVQSALTVIGRRDRSRDPERSLLNLSRINLQRANFSGADLQRANFSESNLQRAALFGARLQGADLREANLQGANLFQAKLQGADLDETDLSNVLDIGDIDLSPAYYLCHTKLPKISTLNPNRDCPKLK